MGTEGGRRESGWQLDVLCFSSLKERVKCFFRGLLARLNESLNLVAEEETASSKKNVDSRPV